MFGLWNDHKLLILSRTFGHNLEWCDGHLNLRLALYLNGTVHEILFKNSDIQMGFIIRRPRFSRMLFDNTRRQRPPP